MRLTQAVGQQIRDDWADRSSGILALEMQVHWTPRAVPEPASMMLVGVALVAAVGRRRMRPGNPCRGAK